MNNEIENIETEIKSPKPENGMTTEQKYPRHHQTILKGNYAAAEAAKLCRIDFVPAYPITPQTTIVEELSAKVARNEMNATYINMDSEHSVFAAAKGAAIAGSRVFTATSGQGLFYAHEVLHAIAHFRLPMVVCDVGRPSIPWNIWSDQTDSLAQRDTGWIQIYTESAQEVLDTIIQSYIITEKLDIPVMIVLDAFYQSHTSENIWIPEQNLVDEFLPPKQMKGWEVDVEHPKSVGGLVPPEHYEKFNYEYWLDVNKTEALLSETGKKFGKHFGRSYEPVEAVNIGPNTKMVLVSISSITTTVRGVIQNHPEIGLLKLRLFKPFPKETILKAFENLSDDAIIVNIERNFLGGNHGAIMQEMLRTLYGRKYKLYDVYTGLGGKDVPPVTIEKIIYKMQNNPDEVTWIDLE